MGEQWYCTQCGKILERHYKHRLCKKHWEEKCKYGFCISDTQMSEDDPSEIRVVDGVGHISLYDILFEETEEEILVDVEDIEKVNSYHWKKQQNCIIGLQLGKPILLPNLILDTENKVEYINGDILDNRKENLKEVKKRNKKSKISHDVPKRHKNKILVEFVGESQNGVVGTSIVCSYPTKEGEYERILIECGQLQLNGNLKEEYIINKEVMQRVREYGNFKAVFVSHAHL